MIAEGGQTGNHVKLEVATFRCNIPVLMNDGNNDYWFRAKRYGWGWGLPITWQGWVVFVVWFAVFISAMRYFIPRRTVLFLVFTLVMSLLLLAICYKKGEPPRWRWGERDE